MHSKHGPVPSPTPVRSETKCPKVHVHKKLLQKKKMTPRTQGLGLLLLQYELISEAYRWTIPESISETQTVRMQFPEEGRSNRILGRLRNIRSKEQFWLRYLSQCLLTISRLQLQDTSKEIPCHSRSAIYIFSKQPTRSRHRRLACLQTPPDVLGLRSFIPVVPQGCDAVFTQHLYSLSRRTLVVVEGLTQMVVPF